MSRWICILLFCLSAAAIATAAETNPPPSILIEVAGRVELLNVGATNWQAATIGAKLVPGARVRTAENSRAAVRLSDLSVVRLNERTTLEILPPIRAERRRFGLPAGSLYFFNRERPTDVEFDTPLASGAIRGTEFLLASSDDGLRLALIDGRVTLRSDAGETTVERGHELRLAAGQPPHTTALLDVVSPIQWALYYPAVVAPTDLVLTAQDRERLQESLSRYETGDLLAALAALPNAASSEGEDARCLRAALLLGVGQAETADRLVAGIDRPAARALRELVATVQGRSTGSLSTPPTPSESLARSFTLQARGELAGARDAARTATGLAPRFGIAQARLAELEFAFGNRHAALEALALAAELSPAYAPAHALRGFIALDQFRERGAMSAFVEALRLDPAYGPGWIGSGLCRMRSREFAAAREAFRTAAALEPQRGLFRAYLGKAASESGDNEAATKELDLAKRLDPAEPTGWFYSGLRLWQQNRLNDAIRDLEAAADRNDNRAVFRSRLLLDGDRAIRSANLAALYADVGLADVSHQAAARAVTEDYAEFSAHLFLANSHQAQEDRSRFNLRLETARNAELLVANLLAPPGAGNLSQLLDQQDHLRFFDPRPLAVASLTEYTDNGDWRQSASFFGTVDGLSYALDASFENSVGERVDQAAERRQFILTAKQRITVDVELYFQVGDYRSDAGGVADYYDPASAKSGFHVREDQEPALHLGWHHAWSAGSHTLFLLSHIEDNLTLHDPQPNLVFVRKNGGTDVEVQSPPAGPAFALDQTSATKLWTAELQQIWQSEQQALVVGGRWQRGDVETHASLGRGFAGIVTDQTVADPIQRFSLYGYETWHLLPTLHLTAGVAYDLLEHPLNSELPPVANGTETRFLLAPKAGIIYQPWHRGVFRAGFARSLGGASFDQSERLEPTQVGGFNQAFRSLVPESAGGLVPGARFDSAGLGFDQSFASGTWFGIEGQWLESDGDRMVGVLTNSIPFLALADSPSGTRQSVAFRERSVSAYFGQLLGESFSVGAHYRVSEAELNGQFPDIPAGTPGLAGLEQDERGVLQTFSLTANFHHSSGVFAQWESAWFHQENSGYTPARPGDDFWQHNVTLGYRLPRRVAELRCSLLNVFDQDYRLSPLNLHATLPRGRTLTLSLRLNF